jgi:putative endonuclease
MTNNLPLDCSKQHADNIVEGNNTFASRYKIEFWFILKNLLGSTATAREKRKLKRRRDKKLDLIRSF